ncbi:MAG: TIGR04255 family protein [Bradymonadaceae bacterium]
MGWNFDRTEPTNFARNPLQSVVGQLSYYPSLRISEKVADFQESIRDEYLDFEKGVHKDISFTPDGDTEVQEEEQFVFKSPNENWRVVLRAGALALESRKHEKREEFIERFDELYQKLNATYDIRPRRLGLRYVNIVPRGELMADLGEEDLAWSDLLNESFLPLSEELFSVDDSSFYTEVNSSIEPGGLVLRFGITDSTADPALRVDLDRFAEDDTVLEDVRGSLETFSTDIYSLFVSAAGDKLLEWMQTEREES